MTSAWQITGWGVFFAGIAISVILVITVMLINHKEDKEKRKR